MVKVEMKIELYSVPNDKNSELIKSFLMNNNLLFKKIICKDKIAPMLKVTYSHGIHIIEDFNEFMLNQLIEHIKKYNPKIE